MSLHYFTVWMHHERVTMSEHEFTNRLVNETSPYLLQHAHNPVDWYPWGPEALEKAAGENKPILLSIGYSACHWCHVMEHESFENEPIAKLMNDNFVCIKVDREERPDLDTIYMNAVQMMTGHGGWPMTVFLTPDGRPFYGGTYFPPVDRHGMPGFPRILIAISEAYQTNREEIEKSASGLLGELRNLDVVKPQEGQLSREISDQAISQLLRLHDTDYGGFGSKPKFPPSMTLTFMLRRHHQTKDQSILDAVELTLQKMALGGMYDQLGGGFHRYSVDEKWLVPHFEKMLYDNALLSRIYLDAWLVTEKDLYKRIATETLDYVRREMTDPNGGFYSTQDADSEGEEGKFFVWSAGEITELLGPDDAPLFCRYFDVTESGNFEEHNILHIDQDSTVIAKLMGVSSERLSEVVERGKRILFEAREKRIKPGRDEKMLTAWNGLMLRSFAEASRVFGRMDYLEVAKSNAEFVLKHLRKDGRLLRTHKDGESRLNGYLEDYSYLIDGLLSLYEATFDIRWFEEALTLAETMIENFWDDSDGGFYFTSIDHESLITRTRDFYDNATPSGNSVAAGALIKLALLTGEDRFRQMAEKILLIMKSAMMRAPNGFGHMLCALDLHLSSPHEIAIVAQRGDAGAGPLIDTVFNRYLPNKVVAMADAADSAAASRIKLLENRTPLDGRATAYVCRNFHCEAPVTDPVRLAQQLSCSQT